ncbi:putative low complexity protein [Tupanvirus deep ocean]|uniref:Low complexity protein n=2 Tax=Tupanvirus TaxID=2094720 RepID=A0AC62A844_9VIRU|nr:putative low complexity protein [Tupanvirus deep ocean]QKU33889.1 putative low complexity protein [Tupanvirus deep ocean]
MDYKVVLQEQLLSKTNIDFLLNTILSNFKISNNAKTIDKCVNILTNNMRKYLENIDRFPENNQELIEAINFLNKKCYNDFMEYLLKKYPNGNIIRNGTIFPNIVMSPSENTKITPLYQSQQQMYTQPTNIDMSIRSPDVNRNNILGDTLQQPVIYTQQQTPPKSPQHYNEVIVLSEDEKNELLRKYEKKQTKTQSEATKTDEFLAYLTNPVVLQMFNMMVSQINQQNNTQIPIKKNTKTEIVVDEILDINQVQALIAKTTQESVTNTKITPTIITKVNEEKKIITQNNNNNSNNDNNSDNNGKISQKNTKQIINFINNKNESDKMENFNNNNENKLEETENNNNNEYMESDEDVNNEENNIQIDLSNITNETLPLIDKRIKELVTIKDKYLKEGNKKMIKEIDKEKTNLINAVIALKQKSVKEAKENESRMNGLTQIKSKDPNENNIERLDLQFDPTNDYNDLKNIEIGFSNDQKIMEISLLSYYLPFNSNNVTRMNNKFMVYFNNKVNKIIIPPGKYEINVLLEAIKSQANFLDFSINEKSKMITIKNTMNMKFELMIDNDTIFPLLGFTAKPDNYKDKLFYEASQPYNLESNQNIYLSLSGSTKDPEPLEFNKEIILEKPKILRKVSRGILMKKMNLNLTNGMGQFYDFIMPFKLCFKITYAD